MSKKRIPPSKSFEFHPPFMNFMGPGTNLMDRLGLKRKGLSHLPLTRGDRVAFEHDLFYSSTSSPVREYADRAMINQIAKLKREGKLSIYDDNTAWGIIPVRDYRRVKDFYLPALKTAVATTGAVNEFGEFLTGLNRLVKTIPSFLAGGARPPTTLYTQLFGKKGSSPKKIRDAVRYYLGEPRRGRGAGQRFFWREFFNLIPYLVTGGLLAIPAIEGIQGIVEDLDDLQQVYLTSIRDAPDIQKEMNDVLSTYDAYLDEVGYYDDKGYFQLKEDINEEDARQKYLDFFAEYRDYVGYINSIQDEKYELPRLNKLDIKKASSPNDYKDKVIIPMPPQKTPDIGDEDFFEEVEKIQKGEYPKPRVVPVEDWEIQPPEPGVADKERRAKEREDRRKNNIVDNIEDMPKKRKIQPKIPGMEELKEFAEAFGFDLEGSTIGEILGLWKEAGMGKPTTTMPKFYDPPKATRLQKMKYLYRTGIDKGDLVQMSAVQLTKLYRERYGQLGRKMIAPPPSPEVMEELEKASKKKPPEPDDDKIDTAKGKQKIREQVGTMPPTTRPPFDPSKVTIPPSSLSTEEMIKRLIEYNFGTKRSLGKLTDQAIRDLHYYAFGDVEPVKTEPQTGFRVEQVQPVKEEPKEEQVVETTHERTEPEGKTENSLAPFKSNITAQRATQALPSQEEQLKDLTNWQMFDQIKAYNDDGVDFGKQTQDLEERNMSGPLSAWYDFTRRQYEPVRQEITEGKTLNEDLFRATFTDIDQEAYLDSQNVRGRDVFEDVTANPLSLKFQYEADINGTYDKSPYNTLSVAGSSVGDEKGRLYADLKKNLNLFIVE
jgi:hypothetical protein